MTAAAPTTTMQGIEVPASSVNPALFFQLTRRLTVTQKTFVYAGLGMTDNVPILQTGIISKLTVNATGSVTVALPTGTCASTAKWPYDLLRTARFAANGQSNLVNCGGSDLKAREIMARGDFSDRGVVKAAGGASPGTAVNQSTLALQEENWGVGSNVTAIAAAAYPIDLEWVVPVAFDSLNLMGAIFAQTSSTDLNLALDWAPVTDLFTLTGTATVVIALTVVVIAELFTIPVAPGGSDVIVPDLSVFHSLIATRYAQIGLGINEIRLSGQGVGRQLLRTWSRTWNGAAGASVPLAVNATSFGQMGWRYGGNDTPELYAGAKQLSFNNEKLFDSDLGAAGFAILDFCQENAFRDSIDMGTATELRLIVEILNSVTPANMYTNYVQETLSAGASV